MNKLDAKLEAPLASSFKWALACNLALVILSSATANILFGVHYRAYGFSLPVGWIPIAFVGFRRPSNPSRSDFLFMFGGFPSVHLAFAAFTRWYMTQP